MKWTYGKEGEAFPVQVGQVWQVGEHRYVCSDLMASKLLDEVLAEVPPTLLYSDPPWASALNGYRTKAGLEKATYTWQDLYARVALIAHSRGIPAWIEGQKAEFREGQQIPSVITHPSAPHREYVQIAYNRTAPCGLYYAGRTPVPDVAMLEELAGVSDWDTPGIVMRHYPAGTVVDPCGGRGQTSRQAQGLGWASVSNELNPNRMSAALARMAKLIHVEPRRIR